MAVNRERLGYLTMLLKQFSVYDEVMHLPTMLVFLAVANKPGIPKTEIEQLVGLSKASSSRNILMLTKEGDATRTNKPGFDLVWTEKVPGQNKAIRCWLTKKGQTVAQSLDNILEVMNARETARK